MHTRRLSTLILGIWTGLTLAMMFVAIQNFRGVDRLLEAPSSAAKSPLDSLGHDRARALLRYQISELNRFFFDWYETAEIALAIFLTFNLLFATNGNRVMLLLCGSVLTLVLFQHFWLTPEITYLGRLIDFVSRDVPSAARSRFWSFHTAYSVLEIVKIALLAAIAVKMLVRGDRRRNIIRPSDLVEESYFEVR